MDAAEQAKAEKRQRQEQSGNRTNNRWAESRANDGCPPAQRVPREWHIEQNKDLLRSISLGKLLRCGFVGKAFYQSAKLLLWTFVSGVLLGTINTGVDLHVHAVSSCPLSLTWLYFRSFLFPHLQRHIKPLRVPPEMHCFAVYLWFR